MIFSPRRSFDVDLALDACAHAGRTFLTVPIVGDTAVNAKRGKNP